MKYDTTEITVTQPLNHGPCVYGSVQVSMKCSEKRRASCQLQ